MTYEFDKAVPIPTSVERLGVNIEMLRAMQPGESKWWDETEAKKAARRVIRRAASNQTNSVYPNQRGASTITTWRPSKRASCSTLANSATSALTLSKSLVPISWCAISRPR